jgi:hypothetical protein
MRDKIISIALAEVGYKESPSGSNMTKYGSWYGDNGKKWCAVFVSWVFAQAGFKWPKQLDSVKGFIWVPVILIRARQFPLMYTRTFDPQPGDIVVFDWNKDGEPDHVGIFKSWLVKGKTFECVEGNTSVGNQSNGGAVMLRSRKIADVAAFIQIIKTNQ